MDIAFLRESYATFIAIIATRNVDSMSDTQNTPAARILTRFGVSKIAQWTGRHRTRIHAWTWPTDKGGTGGAIPHKVRAAIIAGVKSDLGEDLAFSDFEPTGSETYLAGGQATAQADTAQ